MYNWSLRMKGIKYGTETMLVEIIAIFSNLKDISPQIQEVISTPSSMNTRKYTKMCNGLTAEKKCKGKKFKAIRKRHSFERSNKIYS